MPNHEKENPVVKNAPIIPADLMKQLQAAKVDAQQKPNMFPGCHQLGEKLTEQAMQAQAKQFDNLPLMSQAEMLSVLLTCHEMLNESMRELTSVMAQVVEMQQKEHGE